MVAPYCYEGIPLRFLASLFDMQMRYLVYMSFLWEVVTGCNSPVRPSINLGRFHPLNLDRLNERSSYDPTQTYNQLQNHLDILLRIRRYVDPLPKPPPPIRTCLLTNIQKVRGGGVRHCFERIT